jgi:hypothetical protein
MKSSLTIGAAKQWCRLSRRSGIQLKPGPAAAIGAIYFRRWDVAERSNVWNAASGERMRRLFPDRIIYDPPQGLHFTIVRECSVKPHQILQRNFRAT